MIPSFLNRIPLKAVRLAIALILVAASTTGAARAAGDGPRGIFSTPDTATPPTFNGRNQPAQFTDPLFGHGGDPPTRDAIRAIPSMTGKQLGTLDQLIFSNRDAITPMQEELASLRRILDQRKKVSKFPQVVATAPDVLNRGGSMMEAPMNETAASVEFAEEPDEAIKARIEMLTQQVSNTRNRLWPSIKAILSPDQLKQLQSMRFGQLVISSNASTDVPEPEPGPGPMSAHPLTPIRAPARPAPGAVHSHPFANPNLIPHSLVSPVLYTTKQYLYRALWRL
jgi:hypothetical protein